MWKRKDFIEFGQGVVMGAIMGVMILLALG